MSHTLKLRRTIVYACYATISLTACKKEQGYTTTQPSPKTSHTKARVLENDDQTLADIQAFYLSVQNIRDSKDQGLNLASLDDAEFLTEATYNYYAARMNYDHDVQRVELSVLEPAVREGILMKDVADAFWKIKAQLMDAYNKIDYKEKGLASFDLKLTVIDEKTLSFDVIATIKSNPSPDVPSELINRINWATGASNHAWDAKTSSPQLFNTGSGDGQADLVSGLVSGINSTKPNAATVLRQLGISNYWHGTQPSIAYGQLIVNRQYVSKSDNLYTGSNTGGLVSDYNTQQIYGYINTRIWSCYEFTPVDASKVYKKWLTTPNLNFYLGFVPQIIDEGKNNLVIPPNSGLNNSSYTFVDLHVIWNPMSNPQQDPNLWNNQPFINQNHTYQMTYGVITGIALPPTGGLETM
jgi:hypothetical protein